MKAIDYLNMCAALEKDWDDDGADPVDTALIASVRELLLTGLVPDDARICATQVSLLIYWTRDGFYNEWEVLEPYKAEVMIRTPDGKYEHSETTWANVR